MVFFLFYVSVQMCKNDFRLCPRVSTLRKVGIGLLNKSNFAAAGSLIAQLIPGRSMPRLDMEPCKEGMVQDMLGGCRRDL